MLPLPPDGDDPNELRISDADRERMAEILKQHCSAGRLTLDEFSERVEEAFAARTVADLMAVARQLPAPIPPAAPPVAVPVHTPVPGGPPAPAQVVQPPQRRVTRWTVAIFSGAKRRGRWRVRGQTIAVAIFGGCDLDMRVAEVEGAEVVVSAVAIFGGVNIIVPEGVEVELSGIPIFGGKHLRLADVPPLPGAPLIRVEAVAIFGGVSVRSKKSPSEGRLARAERHAELESRRRDKRAQVHAARAEQLRRRAGRAAPGYAPQVDPPQWNGGVPASPAAVPAPVPAPPAAAAAPSTGNGATQAQPSAPWSGLGDGTVTILFSDIVGFTSLTESVGDLRAQEVLRRHNAIVLAAVGGCDGHVVKSQGDGFMIAFAGASKAVRCALRIQDALAKDAAEHPESPVSVRIGIHTGEAIQEAGDYLGSTVILASRIADVAVGGEILVSSLLRELTVGTGEFRFGPARDVALKGISEPRAVHAVMPAAASAGAAGATTG